ncbi:unnamed protein product [Echinostoma caproni]|uniref:Uncharacterized protein n=1 Tax=Echinostoma caproni TaxID=27848 RepID=A0A183BCK8_9TREM|nr:unnamed protein product [Echinostoma caproni]
MSQLIAESPPIAYIGDENEDNSDQVFSSSEEEEENEGGTKDLSEFSERPVLGLIDEENLLVLPPEGYGEGSDNEQAEGDNTYEKDQVRRVLRRFGFREVDEDEDWNLYWTDFSVSLDRVVVMKTWQVSAPF